MHITDISANTNPNLQMYGVIAQFLVAFIALFVALFGTLIADMVHRKFLAPKIALEFDERDPGLCHKTLICAEKIGCKSDYYFRFYVENTGKSMAKNCEIVAEKLWYRTPHGQNYHPYNQFAPMNLKWTGQNRNEININPKRRVIGNIGHIPHENYQKYLKEQNSLIDLIGNEDGTELRFILELTQSFFALPNCLAKGEYYIQIGLYSENAKPEKLYIEIHWTGEWKDELKDMFEQIKIGEKDGPPNEAGGITM